MFGLKKTLKKADLREIDVDLISLLFDDVKPANGKGAIVKNKDGNYKQTGSSMKTKSDDQGRVYVTVYEPDTTDSQGDTATAIEVQKACDRFAKKGMLRKNDTNHDMRPIDECYIAENYILKTADKTNFPDTKIGSWVMVLKFDDLACDPWKKIKAGKFNGVSLFGKADATEKKAENTQSAELQKMVDKLTNAIDTLTAKNDPNLTATIDELKRELESANLRLSEADSQESMIELMKGFNGMIQKMNSAINTAIADTAGSNTANTTADRDVTINGEKIVIKSDRSELYKAIGGVDSGHGMNILSDNTASQFIDTIVDFMPGDTFTDISVIELNKDESVDIGLISDLILRNKLDSTPSLDVEVGTFDLKVPTDILHGRLKLSQETVEFYRDKYGDEAFGAYIVRNIASKTQKAMQKLLFQGDRASTDNSLKGLDGIIKKMTPTDMSSLPQGTLSLTEHFSNFLKTFSNDALSEMGNFVIYCSPKDYLDIQDIIAKRQTAAGDKFLLTNGVVTFKGIPVKPRQLPDRTFIIGIAKFLLLGYRTDATIKCEHDGNNWVWVWNTRSRWGTNYITGGLVKAFRLTTT